MSTPQIGSIDRPNTPHAASVGDTARSNDVPGNDETGDGVDAATNDSVGRAAADNEREVSRPVEIGGQAGPEPTRYGDWENKGRCTDF